MRFLMGVMGVISLGWAVGCASDVEDDPTMYLTGTEEQAVRVEDGTFVCESPDKVLLCHIPPGNPDNAHTICVGAPAVEAHQTHHGDPLGACDAEETEPDAGVPTEPDAASEPEPEPEPDGGVVID